MALGLALYGWDRVQGVVPDAPPGLRLVRDDPNLDVDNSGELVDNRRKALSGDFVSQLPGGW